MDGRRPWLLRSRQAGFFRDFGGAPHIYDPNPYEDRTMDFVVAPNSYEYRTNRKRNDKLHMKYMPDAGGRDGFRIHARGLNIDNSYISQYWMWPTEGIDGIEVAHALRVKWLGVNGSFSTIRLTHDVPYKVSFQLMMAPSGTMKQQMVNLTLTLPNDTNQEKQACLPDFSTGWQELEVGRFKMTVELVGEMKFAMRRQFDSWMGGLIIGGVDIKPE